MSARSAAFLNQTEALFDCAEGLVNRHGIRLDCQCAVDRVLPVTPGAGQMGQVSDSGFLPQTLGIPGRASRRSAL